MESRSMSPKPANLLCNLLLAICLASTATLPWPAAAATVISGADKGPAIEGYDPVAYFTDGKPVRGSEAFSTEWQGATWHFASAEHRDLFIAMPERYAPQYGGYCAYATSLDRVAAGDGRHWRIVDDKLYLNNNWFAHKLWQTDVKGNLVDSERHWPEVKALIETAN